MRKDECRAVMRRRRGPLCTKLKTRLQFLGTVPLLTGADRMQDRPWTPCFSVVFFSAVLRRSFHLSLSLSFFPSLAPSLRPGPLAALHRSIVCNGARTTTLGSLFSCLLLYRAARDKLALRKRTDSPRPNSALFAGRKIRLPVESEDPPLRERPRNRARRMPSGRIICSANL